MATIAPTFENGRSHAPAATEDRFFFRLSVFCLIVGVLGFAPTYWLQLAAGTVAVAPMVHLHGAIFTGWLVFLVGQSWLAAEGKLRRHRAWGKVGISLATLVVVVGIGAALQALETRLAAGQGDPARSFLIVSVSSVLGFAGFIVAAMVNVNRSAWHKRFVIVATLSILAAAVARFFFLARNGMQPGLSVSSFPSTPASLVGPIRAQLLVDPAPQDSSREDAGLARLHRLAARLRLRRRGPAKRPTEAKIIGGVDGEDDAQGSPGGLCPTDAAEQREGAAIPQTRFQVGRDVRSRASNCPRRSS